MDRIWLKSYPDGVPAEIDLGEVADPGATDRRQLRPVRGFGRVRADGPIAYVQRNRRAVPAVSRPICRRPHGSRRASASRSCCPTCCSTRSRCLPRCAAASTVVNTNPLYTAPELEHQLSDSGATAILVLENFAHVVQKVLPRTQRQSTCSSPRSARCSDFRRRRSSTTSCARSASRSRPGTSTERSASSRRWREGPAPAAEPVDVRPETGLPAIHRRHDRRRQGRHADARQRGAPTCCRPKPG